MGGIVAHPYSGCWFDFEISLLMILKRLFTTFCVPGANVNSSDSVKEIISYLTEHAAEKISVGELANEFGYNPSYLSRMFKQQTGVGIVDFLYELRVNRLHADLLASDDSIADLMQKNGLTNRRLARRTFKELYGMLPSEVRTNSL